MTIYPRIWISYSPPTPPHLYIRLFTPPLTPCQAHLVVQGQRISKFREDRKSTKFQTATSSPKVLKKIKKFSFRLKGPKRENFGLVLFLHMLSNNIWLGGLGTVTQNCFFFWFRPIFAIFCSGCSADEKKFRMHHCTVLSTTGLPYAEHTLKVCYRVLRIRQ